MNLRKMTKKILLIDPQGHQRGYNLGLAYVATYYISKDYHVRVLDLNNNREDKYERLINELNRKPDIIGISVKLMTLREAKRIIFYAKKFLPKAKYMAGGCQAILEPESLDFVDELIKGNIEEIHNRYPTFEVFDTFKKPLNPYLILTSVGCPYNCYYCSVGTISGKKWVKREAQDVINELIQAIQRYNITEFEIIDDNFTLDIERAKDICRLIISYELNLKWSCPNGIRADRVDKELLELMKKSGCTTVTFGVESIDEDVFNRINKGESISDVKNGIKLAREAGLDVKAFFIIGLIDSTYKKDMKIVKYARKMKFKEVIWSMLVPYPHTELWDFVNENNYFIEGVKTSSHFGGVPEPIFETETYSAEEKKKAFIMASLRTWNIEVVMKDITNPIMILIKFFLLALKYDTIRFPIYIYEFIFKKSYGLIKGYFA